MKEDRVEVIVQGSASAPIKQTIAIVVNNALKEAGFTEVVLTHTVEGEDKEIRTSAELVTVLDVVSGAYPHLFTTPVDVRITDEPIVEFISVDQIGKVESGNEQQELLDQHLVIAVAGS